MIDLRSDTVTKPTPGMRRAMAEAEVGDDVYGEDPTVNRLQKRIAEILGKEDALFVPSGTMSNQIAIGLHCRPGDELICEAGCHLYNYEQGGAAQLSGVSTRAVAGKNGVLDSSQLHGLIRYPDAHSARTRLVCLENTHNRGGGTVQPLESVKAITSWARENGLATHLDGARLFNAVVASGISAAEWGKHFDTVNVCFSKGLGAPVGSILAGPRELMHAAHRRRKVFGGAMRQAGVLAAAALYALDHHIDRLAEDHANAARLGEAISKIDGLTLSGPRVETNLVIFHVSPALGTASDLTERFAARGLLMIPFGPQSIRAVTHLDISAKDIDEAIGVVGASMRN